MAFSTKNDPEELKIFQHGLTQRDEDRESSGSDDEDNASHRNQINTYQNKVEVLETERGLRSQEFEFLKKVQNQLV
jgi:hypothetical protein